MAVPELGLTRPMNRRAVLRLLAATGATGLLAACGGSQPAPAKPAESKAVESKAAESKPAESKPAAPAAQPAATAAPAAAAKPAANGLPSYYPADYGQIVEASKGEGGRLNVFSIMNKTNWAPVLEGFKQRYSWIEVETNDLDSATIFDRYYTEAAGNVRTADMIITSNPDQWQDFVKRGEVMDYKSPEDDKLPAWSKQAPGIYTVSADAFFFIWNKKLLQTPPTTMAELGDMATKDAAKFTPGRIVTYEETNGSGFAANWFWAKKQGQDKALGIIEAIGKTKPKLETGGGRMVDATLAGETLVGYFVGAINVFPRFPAAQEILGYGMVGDGTPTLVRSMAITKRAQAANSAKLLADFIVSEPGQIAWAEGGLTAYRPDVADQSKLHLSKLAADAGGEQNLVITSFDPDIADEAKREGFRARLKTALGR